MGGNDAWKDLGDQEEVKEGVHKIWIRSLYRNSTQLRSVFSLYNDHFETNVTVFQSNISLRRDFNSSLCYPNQISGYIIVLRHQLFLSTLSRFIENKIYF